jgi:uncharacterized membrane protein
MGLLHGTRGHPLHPPLTDAAIGMYTLAAALAVIGALGAVEDAAGKGMWLALLGGLAAGAAAAVTGLLDWLQIEAGTPLRRTATVHMLVMVSATLLFALAAIVQYDGFHDGRVDTVGLVLTLLAFATLLAGGWIGGSLVFVYGMRVVGDEHATLGRALSPTGHSQEEPAAEAPPAARPTA